MKKSTKIFIIVLSVALLCAAFIFAVSADSSKETVIYTYTDSTGYQSAYRSDSLKDALNAVTSGDKVVLFSDCTINSEINFKKNVTIDLNGYTLNLPVATAFVVNSDVKLTITGSGTIKADGRVVASTQSTPKIEIIGTGEGINIVHTGSKHHCITSVKSGTHTFSNLNVVSSSKSTQNNAKYSALFETYRDATAQVTMVFDKVEMHYPERASTQFFLISLAGKDSHLTVKNSSLYTVGSGIFLGEAEATKKSSEVMLFENSVLSCVAPYEESVIWGLFLEGYNWSHDGTVGVVNVKDSLIECAGRPLYADYTADSIIKSSINVINSTIKSIGTNGSNHNEMLSRWVDVNFDKDSKISATKAQINFTEGPILKAEVGTRLNLISIAQNATHGLQMPDGKMGNGNSENYEWIYDPIGDPEYPYVLVEKANASETIPYFYANFNFEAMHTTPSNSTDTSTHYYIIKGGNTKQTYGDSEAFYQGYYGMQFDIKAGSIYRGRNVGNQYIKYCVTVDTSNHTVSSDGNYVTYKNSSGSALDPYFIVGANMTYEKNLAHVRSDDTYTRAKVSVLDFDFGAESELGYPSTAVQIQTRKTTNKSANAFGTLFSISNNGTISYSELMNDARPVSLKEVGQWNHMTVVFYTDPALNNDTGMVHLYLNGEYMGNAPVYPDANEAYIMGVRFNINKVAQRIGATICLDNISFKAYSEYLYEGETDYMPAVVADEANGIEGREEVLGCYTPEKYVTSTPANTYIKEQNITVSGVPYNTIDEALVKAEIANGVVDIKKDINGVTVTESGTVRPNGYEFNFTTDSYGFTIEDGLYTFNKDYWYTAQWYNGDLSKIENNSYTDEDFVSEVVKLGFELSHTHPYSGTNDFEKFTVVVNTGWRYEEQINALTSMVPAVPELLKANENGGSIKYMPVFTDCRMKYYTKTADSYVSAGLTDDEFSAAYKNLENGETLVLNDNVNLTSQNVFFGSTDDVHKEISLDLNGYTLNYHIGGTVAWVGNNTTFNVYSSNPGGHISSYYLNTANGTVDTNAQRMFGISSAVNTEGYQHMNAVKNAHINVGTYEDIPGSNMSLNGGVILEGVTGSESCSIKMDGVLVEVGTPTSGGAIMTRYYDGEIIVTNSTFIIYESFYLIDMKSYDKKNVENGNAALSPYVLLDGCFVMARGRGKDFSLIGGDGDGDYVNESGNTVAPTGTYETQLEIKNTVMTVNLNKVTERTKIGENVVVLSTAFASNSERNVLDYQAPITFSSLNIPKELTKNGYYAFTMPIVVDNELSEEIVYIVENGKAANVPSGAKYFELPATYSKKFTTESSIPNVTVTFMGLGTNPSITYILPKGACTLIPEIVKYESNLLTLTHNGEFDKNVYMPIESDTVFVPSYNANISMSDIKVNLSLHSDFNINLYIPEMYEEFVVIIGAEVTKVTLDDGVTYTKTSVTRKSNEASKNAVFEISVTDENNYTAYKTITVSIASYIEKVLDDSSANIADKILMYYALNYANEAEKYFRDTTDVSVNDAIESILEKNSNLAGKYSIPTSYSDAKETITLKKAFKGATISLEEIPKFIFILKDGFAGEVSVYAGETLLKNVTVAESDSRIIEIEEINTYDFSGTITIKAVGNVDETSVDISGEYNLDTFVKYHFVAVNANPELSTARSLDLIRALYEYVTVSKAYKEQTIA